MLENLALDSLNYIILDSTHMITAIFKFIIDSHLGHLHVSVVNINLLHQESVKEKIMRSFYSFGGIIFLIKFFAWHNSASSRI